MIDKDLMKNAIQMGEYLKAFKYSPIWIAFFIKSLSIISEITAFATADDNGFATYVCPCKNPPDFTISLTKLFGQTI